jgi:hypothetical protein
MRKCNECVLYTKWLIEGEVSESVLPALALVRDVGWLTVSRVNCLWYD